MATMKKDPGATLDYGFNFNANPPLGPYLDAGDYVTGSTWVITEPSNTPTDPNYLQIVSASIDADGTRTTVWVAKGSVGVVYTLTNQFVTFGGRTDSRSLFIEVQDR